MDNSVTSQRFVGLNPSAGGGLSVWTLRALHAAVWVSSGCSGFLLLLETCRISDLQTSNRLEIRMWAGGCCLMCAGTGSNPLQPRTREAV